MAQFYNMKWNDHITNITKVLKHLLRNETLCDVTLACEGANLKAHKIILSAGSSYFQSMLSENPCCKHPIVVVLKDMHYRELKVILDFMYGGQVIVAENQLHELKRVADALQVKGFNEAVLERCQPGDHASLSKDVQPNQRRRKRRHRTNALINNIDGGASGESKKSDSDVEVVHVIHKESPSSPIENTDEPSNLQDQTTDNIPMQSSQCSPMQSENISNNEDPKFSSDGDIPEAVEPVELPSDNLNSRHQIDVNQVNDSDIEFIDPDCDIVSIPRSRRKRKPKQDTGKDIVPAEEIGVKSDKIVEKILTTDHTPILLEDQIPTEDQPAEQCPDKKSLIPKEFENESSKIEEENLTTDDTTMPFEGQILTEDQPAEQSPDKKCLVPYEIESSETEEKNVSDGASTSFAGQNCIADQQLECSSDSVPIDLDQSSIENFCFKGLVEVTDENNGKSLAIASQQPECSPDDLRDAQAPNINAEDELPPAKRRKKAVENETNNKSDDEDYVP